MKKYIKEIVVILLQILIFYLLPQRMGNIGALGMVFLLLLTTFILSIFVGCIIKKKTKYFYPILVALLFIPNIWIYYNESAFVHALWYFIVSSVGVLTGTVIYKLTYKVNFVRNAFIIIGIIIGIILLDSLQALVFDNSPILKIREYYNGGDLYYKDKGLLVDTYCGTNGIKDTAIKGFSYSLAYDSNITLIDKTKNIKDFAAATALEPFYDDESYTYFWSCIKNKYMIVKYSDGSEELISDALKQGHIDIQILDKFNISYIKEEKFQMYQETPPELFVYLENETTKAKALLGTHSWKILKDGKEEVIMADSAHPSHIKYSDDNTLKYRESKIKIESTNATISSVNIYNIDKTEKIKKVSFDNENIMLGNLKKGEYVLEIIANYSQGKVYYGVKLVVE